MTNEDMKALEATVTSFGWEFKAQCSCGGTLRRKFTSKNLPGTVLVLSPHRGNFHYEENGSNTAAKPLSNIEKELQA